MASPSESTAGDSANKNLEQITFRFCSECSNMLYPKEDPDSHKLQFTCRTCQYTEEATSTCVFRNLMNNAVGETAGVTQDVGSDPTVSIPFLDASASEAPQAGPAFDTVSGAPVGRSAAVGDSASPSGSDNIAIANNPHSHLLDPELEHAIHSVTVASVYQCLGLEDKADWDAVLVSNIASDLAFDMAFGPAGDNGLSSLTSGYDDDLDPPEAMGVEPEEVGILEF